MLREEIFQEQRRYPFPARFDHILDAVGDLRIAVAVNEADIVGVQQPPAQSSSDFY